MESTNGLFVYSYQHDDDQQGWTRVEAFSYSRNGVEREDITLSPDFVEKLRSTLTECGWEGDGHLGAMLVPPFFSNDGDNYWFPIFHVKQGNNGTSWIASERPLGTENLNVESSSKKRR
jgi:hypothetical protein